LTFCNQYVGSMKQGLVDTTYFFKWINWT